MIIKEEKKNNFKTRDTPFFTYDLKNKKLKELENEFPEINNYKLNNKKSIINSNLLNFKDDNLLNIIKYFNTLQSNNKSLSNKLKEKIIIVNELTDKYNQLKYSKLKKNLENLDIKITILIRKELGKKRKK